MFGQLAKLPWARGQALMATADTTSGETLLGSRYSCVDYTPPSGSPVPANSVRSQLPVVVEAVRNVSGISLMPSRLVRYKSAKYGKEVDGYSTTTAADFAGVVDEWWPSTGVPANSVFLIVKAGPCTVLTDLADSEGNDITQGEVLCALTAATSQATTAGRMRAVDFATAATGSALGDQIRNGRMRAMSANTTAQTNRALLVELMHY